MAGNAKNQKKPDQAYCSAIEKNFKNILDGTMPDSKNNDTELTANDLYTGQLNPQINSKDQTSIDKKSQEKILIIDDEAFYLKVLVEMLEDKYQISLAKNGEQALQLLDNDELPDIILLDVVMPGLNGYEICQRIKEDKRLSDIPVIFLTVKSEVNDEIEGFHKGACDYIIKPFSPPIVTARIATHLKLRQSLSQLQNQNHLLEERIAERTEEVCLTQDIAIYCLASLAETRDNETGMHIRRTQHYVRELAEYLRSKEIFSNQIDDDFIELLFKSAPLHDIGKVGVPDRILLKPGKLDDSEWVEMKKHAQHGFDAISHAEEEYGNSTSFLSIAKEIAFGHHEKWDGSGYPQGLKAFDIPLSARLMAVADCYDALVNRRVYKEPFSHETAVGIITDGRASHFDPQVVDAFLVLNEKFLEIAERFKDE